MIIKKESSSSIELITTMLFFVSCNYSTHDENQLRIKICVFRLLILYFISSLLSLLSLVLYEIIFVKTRIILYLCIYGIQIEQKEKKKKTKYKYKKRKKISNFFFFPLFCFVCVYHTGTREHKR